MQHQHIEGREDVQRQRNRREFTEMMTQLRDELPERDRHLVRLVYENGAKITSIAAATGATCSNLYQRLNRIEKRVKSQETQILWRIRKQIPPHARSVVLDHFLAGRNAGQISQDHDVPKKYVYDTIATYREYAQQQIDER